MASAGKHREQDRGDIVDDAAGADPQPLQPDRHRQRDADLQRHFGKAGAVAVDIAAIDGMADFHERQQHREQDRGGFHRAQRRVVAAPAHADARGPERQRRHAIAPQQPVEDRRGADRVADDARLIADPQHHDAGENRREPAQERDRTLQRDPGGAGDISASAMVSQPFSSAKVSASASAASVPVANSAIDGIQQFKIESETSSPRAYTVSTRSLCILLPDHFLYLLDCYCAKSISRAHF